MTNKPHQVWNTTSSILNDESRHVKISLQQAFEDVFDPPTESIREQVLNTAKTYVTKDRQATHGKPESSFSNHALLWTAYLQAKGYDISLTEVDVADMMILFKVGRSINNPTNLENWIDKAGYAACGAEVAK